MKTRVITIIVIVILVVVVGVAIFILNKETKKEDSKDIAKQINQNVINNPNENVNISGEKNNNTTFENQSKEDVFVFEGKVANIPKQIVLNINGRKTVVDGRRVNVMLQELEVDTTKINETMYSGGAIYTKYGSMLGGIAFDEKFKSSTLKELIITKITFTAGGDFGISILDIDSDSTIDDVLNILGTPNYNNDKYLITDEMEGYLLKWNDVKIDEFTIDLSGVFYKDGSIRSLSFNFK